MAPSAASLTGPPASVTHLSRLLPNNIMYCFRFTSHAQFRTLAAAEGLLTHDDELITASHTHAIDEAIAA